MLLEILSAEEKIFSGDVDSVILPGVDGQFQVLNNHAPIVSSLSNGEIVYSEKSKTNSITKYIVGTKNGICCHIF